jgi:hypothetical protein
MTSTSTQLEGLADYLRSRAQFVAEEDLAVRMRRWASEVEALRAGASEPLYRFLKQGDIIEAQDEFYQGAQDGWKPAGAVAGTPYYAYQYMARRPALAAPMPAPQAPRMLTLAECAKLLADSGADSDAQGEWHLAFIEALQRAFMRVNAGLTIPAVLKETTS